MIYDQLSRVPVTFFFSQYKKTAFSQNLKQTFISLSQKSFNLCLVSQKDKY